MASGLRRRIGLGAWTVALLLGLAPIVVVIARRQPPLALLLVLPVAAAVLAIAVRRALRAERELERVVRERARAEAAAEAVLAVVSHELRTPLAVVLGSLDTLRTHDSTLGPEERRELVGMAARQGRHLKRLVEQLLLASRLEQPRGPLDGAPAPDARVGREPAPADGAALVDAVAVIREARSAAELCHPGRPVRLQLDEALPVRAAPEALLQVLTNLLDNAAKYSPAGTPIRLEARRRGNLAVIAVEDAGPGVPPAEREHIFERFIQLDASAGRREGGVGLGLYIARRLARAQGGDLLVRDRVAGDRGARFELRLPLAGTAAARAAASRKHRSEPLVGSSLRSASPRR